MGCYSDPTANMALGNINREFSKREKKAKKLLKLLEEGKISQKALERAKAECTGIYSHVFVFAQKEYESEKEAPHSQE